MIKPTGKLLKDDSKDRWKILGEESEQNEEDEDESEQNDGEDGSEQNDGEDGSEQNYGEDGREQNDEGEEECDGELESRPKGDGDIITCSPKKKRRIDTEPRGELKKLKVKTTKKKTKINVLMTLKEKQSLYHSNLFHLQTEELLSEMSMKDAHRQNLESWLTNFSILLQSMKVSKQYQLKDNSLFVKKKNIKFPLSMKFTATKGIFIFSPPTNVGFVGSFVTNTSLTQNGIVDVQMTLPKECLQSEDWMNCRWVMKRALYLMWLASGLGKASDLISDMQWTFHEGHPWRPVLQVTPAGNLGKKWKVNLFPTPPVDFFKSNRFSPEKNNMRLGWRFSRETLENCPPTPNYNWVCAIDSAMAATTAAVAKTLTQKNFCDGVKLTKIWLRQRNLYQGRGGVSGFVVCVIVTRLIGEGKITCQMSSYQVFRVTLQSLSIGDWNQNRSDISSRDEFSRYYPVVLLDPTAHVNVTAQLFTSDFLRLKYEAELALATLDSPTGDSFDALFIRKYNFLQTFDQILSIKLSKKDIWVALEKCATSPSDLESLQLDRPDGDTQTAVWSHAMDSLMQGLGDRVAVVAREVTELPVWSIGDEPVASETRLTVGLVLNAEMAGALLTKGPIADSNEAAHFRSFWGSKSSLRRFQDGSFHEGVLWLEPSASMAERRLVSMTVAMYVLEKHCGINASEGLVLVAASQLEQVLGLPHCHVPFSYGTGEEASVKAIQSADSLGRQLRSLELPLKVASFHCVSQVVRHACVFPPLPAAPTRGSKLQRFNGDHMEFTLNPVACPLYRSAMEVIIFLEISGKWPDESDAIAAVKAEFHRQLCDQLTKAGTTAILFPDCLLLFWEGYVFRLRVCYRREIYMKRLVATPSGDWKELETDESVKLETEIEILPRLTTALASLQAEHPSYGASVRLVKRWVSAQLLMPHIPHLVVELLVAHLHVSPAPCAPPHTPQVAFLRFLQLIISTDWKTTLFMVNFAHDFSVEDVTELNRRFSAQRDLMPALAIVTPAELRPMGTSEVEPGGGRYRLASLWSRSGPSELVLHRARKLAKSALEFLTNNLFLLKADIKTIFRPSFANFDVIIRLNTMQKSRREENIDWIATEIRQLTTYEKKISDKLPIVEFDPVGHYLEELQNTYGYLALFLYDEHGGNGIGVVWKPMPLEPREVKIGSFEGHCVVGVKEIQMIPNLEAVVEDFAIMGHGLVQEVKVKSK